MNLINVSVKWGIFFYNAQVLWPGIFDNSIHWENEFYLSDCFAFL